MRVHPRFLLVLLLVSLASSCKGGGRVKSDDEKRAEATIDACISEGKDLAKCGSGGTPAMWVAAAAGAPDAVRKLVSKGASPDVMHKGETPLYEAAKRQSTGHVEVVRVLLEAGADPNKKLAPDESWLHSPRTPFFKAAGNPNSEVLALMLAKGADLKIRGDVGALLPQATALHHAAMMGLHANVSLLLKAGVDRGVTVQGHTALQTLDKMSASSKEQFRGMARLWAEAPADVVDYEKTRALLAN